MNTKTAETAILNPCTCRQFEVVIREWAEENGQPEIEAEDTGCNATTRREFSPGCDAKLKSLLIRAGIAGYEVRRNMGGVVAISTAEKAAEGFGFAHMVVEGIARGAAKAAAKADRQASRTKRPARTRKAATATEPTTAAAAPEAVKIKIGRWEYAATIAENGDAHYRSAKGDDATAVQGTYKLA